MSGRMASFWLRAVETAVALLALVVPLAFLLHSYDAASLKLTLLEAGALVVVGGWLVKGLERGRWELPAQALPSLVPAALLAAWTVTRAAAAPSPAAAIPAVVRQLLGLALFAAALLECGGARAAARFRSWLLAAAWVAGGYALLQRAGFDPLPWKGAFGGSSFSSLGSPQGLGLFAAACAPLSLSRLVEPERDGWARGADAALLLVLGAAAACAAAPSAAAAFACAGAVSAVVLPAFLPSRSSLKAGLAGLALSAAAASLALALGGAPALLSAPRRALWSAAGAIASEHPLGGAGPGRFALELDARRPRELAFALGHDARPLQAPGLLAEQACELGLVGAGLWTWLFAAVLLAAWRARRRFIQRAALEESAQLAGLVGALVTLLVAGQWTAAAPEAASWLLWPLAGLAAGLSLLAARGPAAVLPIGLTQAARRRLAAASLLAVAACLFVPARWQEADVTLNAAAAAARSGAYGEAARLAQAADVLGAPHALEARYVGGGALLAAGRPEEALRRFESLEAEAPAFALLQYQKGRAELALSRWELAQFAFQRQQALDPTFVPNLEGLAVAAKEAGHFDEARRAALAAIALEPQDPVHYLALSDIYRRERRLSEAHEMQQRAARLRRRSGSPPKSGRG